MTPVSQRIKEQQRPVKRGDDAGRVPGPDDVREIGRKALRDGDLLLQRLAKR